MFESPLDELEVTDSRSRLCGLLDSPGNRQVNLQQQQSGQLMIVLALETCPMTQTNAVDVMVSRPNI